MFTPSSAKVRRGSLTASIALGAIGVLVLSGCSAGSDAPNDESAPRDLVTQAAPAEGEVDSLVWNLPTGEPSTIDPPNAPTLSGAGVVSNLCDSLLTHDAEYNLAPNIVDYEVVDPTTIVYTVVDDATFWNGNPVTAEDVAYSLKRSADPTMIVSFLYANVSSIEVTGESEVTVKFAQPDEMFNIEMTTFAGMVVEKAFAEEAGEAFGTAAGGIMCSGPFVFEEWVAGDHITMSRNDTYWNADRRALASEVKFTFVTDTTAYTQAMAAGEIDGSYEISAAAISALENSDEGELYFGPSMQSVSLTVARPDGPLSDIAVRNAFQKLVNREAIADVVYDGAAAPMYTFLAPATWQVDAKEIYEAAYQPFVDERQFDIEKATEMVADSDYDGEEIVIAIPSGEEALSRIAQLVQQDAKQAGLVVTIKTMQPLDYSEAQYDPTKRTGVDFFLGTSFNGVQDPLEPTGFVYLPGAFYNLAEFDNDRVTDLIRQSLSSFDAEERATLYVELQELTEADSAVIPLVSTNTITFLNKRLAGAVTSFAYLTMPALAFIGAAE